MGGPPDSSGAKNAIQGRASTVSYLERYTLKAILGVSEQEDDDDAGGGAADDSALLAEFQAAAGRGEKALLALFTSKDPGKEFWTKHGPALKATAKGLA
jgi:hypothetical protein